MSHQKRSKVYVIENYDGVYEVAVVAANLVSAAKRAGTSPYQMKRYGYYIAGPGQIGSDITDYEHLYRRPIKPGSTEAFVLWREVSS